MQQDLETLAAELRSVDGSRLEWTEALSVALLIPERDRPDRARLRRLAEASRNPERLRLILEALQEFAREHPEARPGWEVLLESVDQSDASLREWLEALDRFYAWLGKSSRVAGLRSMLGYVTCCDESRRSDPAALSLPDTLEEMLADYGYDG